MKRHPVIASETVFDGKIFEVVVDQIRLPSGEVSAREYIKHPGAVGVIALESGSILMVRQNRHAVGEDLLEIPAGKLDRAGEDPGTCARRELMEETGYECEEVDLLVHYFSSPGFTDEQVYLFAARGLKQTTRLPVHDEGEPITIEWLPVAQANEAVKTGKVVDAKSVIALLMAADLD